jgi:hypothetical protein
MADALLLAVLAAYVMAPPWLVERRPRVVPTPS